MYVIVKVAEDKESIFAIIFSRFIASVNDHWKSNCPVT